MVHNCGAVMVRVAELNLHFNSQIMIFLMILVVRPGCHFLEMPFIFPYLEQVLIKLVEIKESAKGLRNMRAMH